ncbi:LysR family transcriptional regulator [Joostella atrarenae]|uniref:LysR family transcriptional regulator n=1 Tax=Joostella atrarenae TaxID=679257 RepID=A0ABS9J1X4_9FLAO|nr:LysR family transcriptional regulator [Joostella atrarenae]MCF8714345.1 LysR family transcriptional regulator [Joostella atrarenae]
MLAYKLHIFNTVAMRLSFSKAAEELHITQPAVTRHIKQLESHFKQKLFERKGNSIELTKAGNLLLVHVKELLKLHRALEFDMNALNDNTEGRLQIGASTTIAQYVLPEVLAGFHKMYPKTKVTLINGNTEAIEQKVLDQTVEIGCIEGHSKNRQLSYHSFLKDEIVFVVAKGHSLYNKSEITLNEVKTQPLIIRERGSGTLEFILKALEEKGVFEKDLTIEMQLGSPESIKSYIKDKRSVAFMSVNTILDELSNGSLRIIDIRDFYIKRNFSYIVKQGNQSSLSQLFINYLENHYNILL